jgi:hypothetical protein
MMKNNRIIEEVNILITVTNNIDLEIEKNRCGA